MIRLSEKGNEKARKEKTRRERKKGKEGKWKIKRKGKG